MKKILTSHPVGNQNVRNAAVAFAESDLLAELWVGAAWDNEHWVNELLPSKLRIQLQRRSFPKILKPYLRHTFAYEATRMMLPMLGLRNFGNRSFSIVAAHERLDKIVADRLSDMSNVGLIYGYDHCALETFKVAKQQNIRRVLEIPIPPWRGHINVLKEEIEWHPSWFSSSSSIQTLSDGGPHKDAELDLAEMVIAPSNFVRKCLMDDGIPAEIIRVIPYGAPRASVIPIVNNETQPLKVLFVGRIGLLKGVPYLFDALKKLDSSVHLTLIGGVEGNQPEIVKEVNKHTWYPSLPHDQVLAQMHQHDVLVFPSLFDGFGLVILEALSQGLPVITTPNTGGTHVIKDGLNGYIVPIRSCDAIAEKLALLDQDRELLAQMRQAALTGAADCSWDKYRNQLVKEISTLLC